MKFRLLGRFIVTGKPPGSNCNQQLKPVFGWTQRWLKEYRVGTHTQCLWIMVSTEAALTVMDGVGPAEANRMTIPPIRSQQHDLWTNHSTFRSNVTGGRVPGQSVHLETTGRTAKSSQRRNRRGVTGIKWVWEGHWFRLEVVTLTTYEYNNI